MATIYLDTSFLINLGEAEPSRADQIVSELDRLEVRWVKSSVLFMELSRVSSKAENHAKIIEQLSRLGVVPLQIGDDDWSALRPGPHRERLGEFMRTLDEIDIYSRAVCSAANMTNEYQRFLIAFFGDAAGEIIDLIHRKDPDLLVRVVNETYRRKNPDIIRQFGEVQPSGDLDRNGMRIIRHQALFLRNTLENADISTGPLPDFDSMSAVEASMAFLDWLKDALGPEVDLVALKHQMDASITSGDDRGLRLMEASISDKSRARFSSSLRDSGHMAIFASFSHDIDYLQVDGPRLNNIRQRPDHYLNRLGLGDRVFAAGSLDETVMIIQQLCSQPSPTSTPAA
jgi:predicted nucleic acid-binding protein